jgi:hypothetical protein
VEKLQRFFLLVIFLAFALETQGSGDTWANFVWHYSANLSSWLPIRIVVSLFEILLLLSAVLWLRSARKQHPRLRIPKGTFGMPLLIFGLLLAFGVLYGAMQSGSNLTIALWEVRSFACMFGAYFLAGMYFRTASALDQFIWTAQFGATALAIANILRWVLVLSHESNISDIAYDHGDSMILAFAVVLGICLLFFGGTSMQRRYTLWSLPLYLICMGIMQRRAAFAVLAVGLVVCAVFILRLRPRAFWRVCVPAAVLIGIYLIAFWHNTGFWGQPARAISSMFSPDPRDASSNFYRMLEKIDIQLNIQRSPILGLGFGQQFTFYVQLPDLSFWPFWHYMPHNSVLWVWMKDGILGFFALWWLLGRAVYDGSRALITQREHFDLARAVFRHRRSSNAAVETTFSTHAVNSTATPAPGTPSRLPASRNTFRSPTRRAKGVHGSGQVALLVSAVAMVPMLIAFAYVDLGLTNERILLLMGLLLGILARAPITLGLTPQTHKTSRTILRATTSARAGALSSGSVPPARQPEPVGSARPRTIWSVVTPQVP